MKSTIDEIYEARQEHNKAMVPYWFAFYKWQIELENKVLEFVNRTVQE